MEKRSWGRRMEVCGCSDQMLSIPTASLLLRAVALFKEVVAAFVGTSVSFAVPGQRTECW